MTIRVWIFIIFTFSQASLHGWGDFMKPSELEAPLDSPEPSKPESTNQERVHRSRDHVEKLLKLKVQKDDWSFFRKRQDVYKELVHIHKSTISPLESLYNFQDLGIGCLTENDISAKPIFVFLGTWSTGKSSMINYLLNLENSSNRLYTGAEPTTSEFTILTHGDSFKLLSGKVLATNHQFQDLEKFGATFLEKLKGIQVPRPLLERMVVVDTPGTIENKVDQDRGYSYGNVSKWFIERSSVVFFLFDPFRLNIGRELEEVFSIMKGQESKMRIILNKADTVSARELVKVYGTLMWNISPMSKRVEPPRVYVGSFWGYEPHWQSNKDGFQADEESLLRDIHQVVINSVENKISQVRNYAQKVYLHAAIVDKYIEAFNRERSMFGDNEAKWQSILDQPEKFDIFESFTKKPWSINPQDVPSRDLYKQFFKVNKPKRFQPLSSHCSFIWGCQADKIKETISSTLPKLLVKFQMLADDRACDGEGYEDDEF